MAAWMGLGCALLGGALGGFQLGRLLMARHYREQVAELRRQLAALRRQDEQLWSHLVQASVTEQRLRDEVWKRRN
jgi:hypothetical protein